MAPCHSPTFACVSEIVHAERCAAGTGSGHLVALVVSHAQAPIATWGPLILPGEAVQALLAAARHRAGVRGLAVLATCSRTELYAEVDDEASGAAALRTMVQEVLALDVDAVAPLRVLAGADVARHLLRVASGLESIALGEHEVLGQVREALRRARAAGTTGALVQRLFERALATGARVRHETEIGRGALTLGAAAAAAVTEAAPPSRCAVAIVVGAGHMARQAARHLRERGFGTLAIVNRTPARAQAVAREVGGSAHPLDALPALLARACVVVAAVRTTTPLITPATLVTARLRLDEPLQLVDLGSPPGIAPACDDIPGVRRLDLDALHRRLASAHASRTAAFAQANAIVQEEWARFLGWWRHRCLVPAARHLRERFLAEARVVVERESRHLETASRAHLERVADALVRRLLHGPLTHLRTLAHQEGATIAGAGIRTPPPTDATDTSARLVLDAYVADLVDLPCADLSLADPTHA